MHLEEESPAPHTQGVWPLMGNSVVTFAVVFRVSDPGWGGGGDSHIKKMGVLVKNFEKKS